MRALEPWHIILLVIVLLVLFGSKRLPDAARGLGRSLRIFKSEVKDLATDNSEQTATPTPTPSSSAASPAPSTPPAQLQAAPAPPPPSAPASTPGAGADGARDSVTVPRE
jgi:sec-independent protein translocase protein TatA